jgi:7-cyano-7-deazaguanine synthase
MSLPSSVVLLSGGMDSCVTLAMALRESRPHLLHVHYGQRTQAAEERAFRAVADHYAIPEERRLIVDISHLTSIGGSSLTDLSEEVEDGKLDGEGIPRTYVPFRNGNLLSIAASWAEVLGAQSIWLGVVEEDGSGYPDCRASFISAMEQSIRQGSAGLGRLVVRAPLISMNKSEIVRQGLELNAPLDKTWSCYRSGDAACGTCDSCLLRLRAFERAGKVDSIHYCVE